eukprot:403128-Pleurochrysis_carterae.AAC.3
MPLPCCARGHESPLPPSCPQASAKSSGVIVKKLLDAKADANLKRTDVGTTALIAAAAIGDSEARRSHFLSHDQAQQLASPPVILSLLLGRFLC